MGTSEGVDLIGMGGAQGMRGAGGLDSSDEISQWTQVRASSDQPQHTQNLGALTVYDPAMVTMDKQIGEGGQGCIYEAKFYLPFSFKPLPVVVKRFKPLGGVSQGQFPPEMASAKCLNVCKPLGVVFKGDSLCIIMQRYSCDLRVHIDAHMKDLRDELDGLYYGPPFPKFEAEHIILQLALGMKRLHDLGIYHRDLKAANILVIRHCQSDGKPCPINEVHITDFERSEDVVGTGFFRAPEVLLSVFTGDPLSEDQWMLADIYSFGMVCYEVLTGNVPFDGHRIDNYDLVLDGGRPELPDYVPARMKDMIRRCWHADPVFRPSWTDILQVLTEPTNDDYGADAVLINRIYMNRMAILDLTLGSSIESNLVKLKQLLTSHKALDAHDSKGFANYVYWAEEFLATAEEYVSKFDVEYFSSEGSLLCKWPEYVERRELDALLFHQFLAYPASIRLSSHSQTGFVLNFEAGSLSEYLKGREEIRSLMMSLILSIDSQLKQVRCVDEFDEEMSWIGKLLFFHAFIKWQLWTEVICPAFGGKSILEQLPKVVNPKDGVNELILLICLTLVVFVETFSYVLAVFTYEPIVLCLQYGLYRIQGSDNFLYRSSGYRICRLQRAWMNYSRHKLLSAALILSLTFLYTFYRWKGVLMWIVFPCLLRSSPYWRPATLLQ